jgi:hypothetical protein
VIGLALLALACLSMLAFGVAMHMRDSRRQDALVEHIRTHQRVGTFEIPTRE